MYLCLDTSKEKSAVPRPLNLFLASQLKILNIDYFSFSTFSNKSLKDRKGCYFRAFSISMMLRILSLSEAFILPPESHKIDCEFYNETNCTEKGDCATKVEHCETESDKLSDCYVLWSIDKATGECSNT
uniref:Uncharacterized protein n=1 Tax=Glossina brevipalpis TaxID=37001 RepID=A0A1A9WMM2_9MUSC